MILHPSHLATIEQIVAKKIQQGVIIGREDSFMTDGSLVQNNNIFDNTNTLTEQSGLENSENDDYFLPQNYSLDFIRRNSINDIKTHLTPEGLVLNYSYIEGGTSRYSGI